MELASKITQGCVEAIWESKDVKDPIVQVVGIKKLSTESATAGSQDRYRLMLSDGTHFMPSVLSATVNHFVVDQTVLKNGLIQLRRYVLNLRNGKKLAIVLDMTVIHQELPQRVGDPKCIDPSLFGRPSEESGASSHATTHEDHAQSSNESFATAAATTTSYVATSLQPQQPSHSHYASANTSRPGFPAQNSSDFQSRSVPTASHSSSTLVRSPNDDGHGPLFPIRALNPYQNRWTIRARVTAKSDIRFWRNAKGDGKLFSCDLIDESGEIRSTFFNEAVDKFHGMLEVNKVYLVTGASVKPARKQFSTLKNEYELSVDLKCQITLVHDHAAAAAVPTVRFAFVPIQQLPQCEKDAMIDLIAVVKDIDELSSVTSRTTQKQIAKRDLTLIDLSGRTVRFTLWNQQAEQFAVDPEQPHPVLAIKGAKVSDYQGQVTLGSLGTTVLTWNPDVREAHALRGWYDSIGSLQTDAAPIGHLGQGQSMIGGGMEGGGLREEERKTFAQIKEENLGQGEKPAYFQTRGTVMMVKSDATFAYPACPAPNCGKKVTELGPQQWHCEKCQKDYPQCEYRYILNIQASDASGNAWLSCFNETGQQIMGRKADDMMQWKQNGEMEVFDACFNEAMFKSYNFKIRAKAESYQDALKTRCHVMSLTPVDYIKDAKMLIADIRKMIA